MRSNDGTNLRLLVIVVVLVHADDPGCFRLHVKPVIDLVAVSEAVVAGLPVVDLAAAGATE